MRSFTPIVATVLSCTAVVSAGLLPPLPRPFPAYVLRYAPISHLWSKEIAFPSDISEHLKHVVPQVNFTDVAKSVTFQTIGKLGSDVFLTSKDAVETQPAWMNSTENKPNAIGFTPAPATIIAVEKKGGILDAFYFYFYSYDQGNNGTGHPPGNHIGDWEHSMVRFVNGKPSILYISAHSGGEAIQYDKTILRNGRATTYISLGTHANYATTGLHAHGTDNTLLDHTDNGPIWDVTLNYRGYWFDNSTQKFSFALGASSGLIEEELGNEGLGWLNFKGMWGDQQYPVGQHGQFCDGANCLFASGPTGPIAKNLGRTLPCQKEANCPIITKLIPGTS